MGFARVFWFRVLQCFLVFLIGFFTGFSSGLDFCLQWYIPTVDQGLGVQLSAGQLPMLPRAHSHPLFART